MILLVVARETRLVDLLSGYFTSQGGNVIHYRNPIKAMDNLEEIQPDAVAFFTQDFPRHWKPFVRYYRNLKSKDTGLCVLFTGNLFTEDEAAKSQLLEINGLIPYDQDDHLLCDSFQEIIQRYGFLEDNRQYRRYAPRQYDNISFIFNHPENFTLVTGTILDVSMEGVRFFPDSPDKTVNLEENRILQDCSLQIEDEIFTFSARIFRNNKVLSLIFIDAAEQFQEALSAFISSAPERAVSSIS